MIRDKQKNQVFDYMRFKQYAKAHFSEQKRSYFWFFAIVAMIYFLILLMIAIDMKYKTGMQMWFMYFGLCVTGSIFVIRYFASLAKNESALMTLMQPVSTFEKWLLAMLTIVVAYPIMYTLLFEIMTLPIAWLSQQLHTPQYHERYQLYVPFFPIEDKSVSSGISISVGIYLFYCILTGYALTASIFFKNLPFIKTIVLGFILFIIFLFFAIVTIDNNTEALFYLFLFMDENYQGNLVSMINSIILFIVVPLLLWTASFYALKERDL